jgi:hypothetical protein
MEIETGNKFQTWQSTTFLPKATWKWDVFGSQPQLLSVELRVQVPLWRRIITRIFLGSVWTRVIEK